jgi:hypothetical protein
VSRSSSIWSRHRRAHGQAGCRIDCPDAFRHLKPKRADVPNENLERRAQLGHFLEVARTEVWPFQLLLAELGQRVQTATEQGTHLLGGHRVAGGQAVDAIQARTDPQPGRFTALGVVRRQPV